MGVTELAMAIERMLRSNTRGRSMRFDTVRVGVLDVTHRQGRARLSDLAAELDVNPSSVTRCVQELTEGGLVRLVENPEDGRSSYVELTEEGRGEWTRYREAGISALGRVLQDWSEEDVLELTRLLGRLTDDWEAAPFHVAPSPLQRAPQEGGWLGTATARPPRPRARVAFACLLVGGRLTMSHAPRVLIAGASLSGLALAQALHSAGFGVEVFERDDSASSRGQGYRLTMESEGIRALGACLPQRLYDLTVATSGKPGNRFTVYDKNKNVLNQMVFPPGPEAGGAWLGGQVDRFTLRQILLGGLADRVHFGKAFSRYELRGDGVTAYFADSTHQTGELLVGADGIGSGVRQQLLPGAAVIDTGTRAIFGRSPFARGDAPIVSDDMVGSGVMAVASDRRVLFFTSIRFRERPDVAAARLAPDTPLRDREDYVMWAVVFSKERYPSQEGDGRALQEVAEAMVEDFDPEFGRIVKAGDPTDTMIIPIRTSPPVPSWETCPVTLLGDAIHCMPPFGALGANTALRDASTLARVLISGSRSGESMSDATRVYEAEMRRYGAEAVQAAEAGMRQIMGA